MPFTRPTKADDTNIIFVHGWPKGIAKATGMQIEFRIQNSEFRSQEQEYWSVGVLEYCIFRSARGERAKI
jgi:hypothetical protein